MTENKKKLQVLDAIPGSGKSTWAFEHMKQHDNKKWLYVSPFLSEVGGKEELSADDKTSKQEEGRIQKTLPELAFKFPTKTPTKTRSLERLLCNGDNIAITHVLFEHINPDMIETIRLFGYNIMIDESVEAIGFYTEATESDMSILLDKGILVIQDDGRVTWNHNLLPDYTGVFSELKDLCDLGSIWYYRNNLLVQRLSPRIVEAAESVTVLTYRFEHSLMKAWCTLNNVEHEYVHPQLLKTDQEVKGGLRNILNIMTPSKRIRDMNTTEHAFSSSWYKRASQDVLDAVSASVTYVAKSNKYKAKDLFWTCFKAQKSALRGKLFGKDEQWVAHTMKATNEYADKSLCVYLVNKYPDVNTLDYLNKCGVNIDKDEYALSDIIQFVFRGCIRKNRNMGVYIPSDRMRNLLQDWLSK